MFINFGNLSYWVDECLCDPNILDERHLGPIVSKMCASYNNIDIVKTTSHLEEKNSSRIKYILNTKCVEIGA